MSLLEKMKIQLFITSLFVFLPFTFVNATHKANHNPLEFSLSASSQITHNNFSANTYETKTGQIGIDWYEHFNDYFHAGLEIGYIDMSQGSNPLASAKFTSGEYTGLLLRFLPIDNQRFTFLLNLNYRYNRTQGKSTNQESLFVWSETLFSGELQIKPTDSLDLFLAAEYQILGGEQLDSGNITQTSQFTGAKNEGYRFGIHFRPNHHGTISVEWMTGFRDGVRIYFKHKY